MAQVVMPQSRSKSFVHISPISITKPLFSRLIVRPRKFHDHHGDRVLLDLEARVLVFVAAGTLFVLAPVPADAILCYERLLDAARGTRCVRMAP